MSDAVGLRSVRICSGLIEIKENLSVYIYYNTSTAHCDRDTLSCDHSDVKLLNVSNGLKLVGDSQWLFMSFSLLR
jgi:hypothetical protein